MVENSQTPQDYLTVVLFSSETVISEKQMPAYVKVTEKVLNGFAERLAYTVAIVGPVQADRVTVACNKMIVMCDIHMFRNALENPSG